MRLFVLCLITSALLPSGGREDVPVLAILQEGSSIKFHVKASVAIDGTFDKWDATATMTSPDVETGVLDIKIQAASVSTGSGMEGRQIERQGLFRRRARSV